MRYLISKRNTQWQSWIAKKERPSRFPEEIVTCIKKNIVLSNSTKVLGIGAIVAPTTKNATSKNHPKDILCYKNHLYSRVGQYWICDMRLLHELFIAIIAILHAKIKAPSHSFKSLHFQYECFFSLQSSLQTQILCWQINQMTRLGLVRINYTNYEAQNWHTLGDKCNNYYKYCLGNNIAKAKCMQ